MDGKASGEGRGPAVPGLVRSLGWAGVGVAAYLGFRALSLVPWGVERFYASWLGPALARGIGAVTSAVDLPVALLVLAAAPLVAGWSLRREWRRARERGWSAAWGVATWGVRLAGAAGVATLLFYLLWGLHYARPPLADRLGWEEGGPPRVEELRALASEAVEATNRAYRALHGSGDAGRATPRLPRSDRDAALREGWRRVVSTELGGVGLAGGAGVPAKALRVPGLLPTLGIHGFYFPFTAEPIIHGGLPGMVDAVAAAHEQAHSRGIAPEDEASFVAILVTTRSPDPHAHYSGWLNAQRRLLAALGRADRAAAQTLVRERLPGVARDIDAWSAYVRSMEGPVNRVSERVNDAYLRSNRVEGGILSYGLATRLLVGWARENGGTLAPGS